MKLFGEFEPLVQGPRRRRPGPPPPPPKPAGRQYALGQAAKYRVTTADEDRTGLTLVSADTAGNVAISAFSGQTAAQHPFVCVAVLITWLFANDPALAVPNTTYLTYTANPTIKSKPITDGFVKAAPGQQIFLVLAKPMRILESTGLQAGTCSLVLGTANMRYSTQVTYMTELDFQLYRRSSN